ncbi:MAG: 3'-5' exonuclease, partial [Coriobacteriales bacterium]|nr:3'-5' exonuclease [Coriobacteriales bacterium]
MLSPDSTVIILDTETTGFDPERERVIELAAARVEQGKVVAQLDTYLNIGMAVPAQITELTSITTSDLADAPTFVGFLPELLELIGDAPIVAHNAPFDQAFVEAECARAGQSEALAGHPWIDSLQYARIAFPEQASHSMASLTAALGITNRHAHRAIGDVLALAELWQVILTRLAELPPAL